MEIERVYCNEVSLNTFTISIVTPSYNQRSYIDEALQSVRAQKYPCVEHIVVDGASSDGTVELLKHCSRDPGYSHLRWISEPDRGQSDALNKGFRMATGDVIGWLNSDDRYRPGCLHTVAKAFAENMAADIIYGDYTWIDEDGRLLQIRREIEFSHFILRYHKITYIQTVATFFRRYLIDRGNFIDINLHYAMDYEFFLRLASQGYRFKHIPKLLADFRWQPQSKSSIAAHSQFFERDIILMSYSELLARLPQGVVRNTAVWALRKLAGGLRYSKKLVRGYYLEQLLRGFPLVTSKPCKLPQGRRI